MRLMKSLFASATCSALIATAAHARPMTIEDLPNLQDIGEIAISSEGVVAYTLVSPRDVVAGEDDGLADIHLYVARRPDAGKLYVGANGIVANVQFSEDGRTLYFLGLRGEAEVPSLYEMPLYGGEATKRFAPETGLIDFAVSADKTTLYFVALDAAPPEREKLAEKGFKAYAYEEDLPEGAIYTLDLTNDSAEPELLYDDGHISAIELSPDGSTLAAVVAPSPLIDDDIIMKRIRILDAATGAERSRIENPGKLGGFRFSPTGDALALYIGTDINDPGDGVLAIADTATGALTQLTAEDEQHVTDVEWLGDNEILTVTHASTDTSLIVYDRSGEVVRTLAEPDGTATYNASLGGGRILVSADSPSHPRALFEVGTDEGPVEWANHNDWLDEIDLAEQSVFTYEARDGRQIDGLLITPDGETPENGWPLILHVHGGPEAHYSNGWLTRYSMAGQIGAGKGYAVFYPNYRGSTGRGVAFQKEHQNDYAGKEFNDLVDGVDALVEAGIVAEDRVGITGGSYGGYASMWGATALTDHFAAAVAFVGISNQISKFGTSDIPNEMYLVHSLKWPWEDWMNLLERSPVFHAETSRTPTLILHGALDTRVHPSQSMELYRALKVHGNVPVRLIWYPEEAHGNRKAAAQMDYAMRLFRWMDTYLRGETPRIGAMPPTDLGLAEMLDLTEEAPALPAEDHLTENVLSSPPNGN